MDDDKRKLTGHPWHIEFLKMAENDTRRDKRKCRYFLRDESHKNYCQKNFGNCIGSSHCSFYEEGGAEKTTQKTTQKQINEMIRKIFEER